MSDDRLSQITITVCCFVLAIIIFGLYTNQFTVSGVGVFKTQIVNPLESNGAVPVNIQDQHTEIVDYYFTRAFETTNPSFTVVVDSYNLTVDDVTGAVQGLAVNVYDDESYYQAIISGVVGDVIQTNVPFDKAFSTDAVVEFAYWNMAVDASGMFYVYSICPPGGVEWDITRNIYSITDEAAMDDGLFGGIPSLPNGVVLRVDDGYKKNIFVVNDNGGFGERAYDTAYIDKAPAGQYAFRARRTFAGQDKNGVTIRLNGADNDCLQLIINDDLSDLTKFAATAQGHRVTD